MGKPKLPPAPAPLATPPDFASSFADKLQGSLRGGSANGTFMTGAQQPLIRRAQRKSLLGQ